MIIVVAIAMLACMAIGVLIGWLLGSDREPATDPPGPETRVGEHVRSGPGRHAQTEPLRLKHVPPTEAELAGYYAAAASHFPGLAAQPRLAELVDATPGPRRTTDFIDKVKADTDRWLAARGLEDVSANAQG